MRAPLVALLLSVGCGGAGDERATSLLTWRFADGRGCAEAGVAEVKVTATDGASLGCTPATCDLSCADGEAAGLPVAMPADGADLRFAATSPPGNTLYRGALRFDGEVPPAAVVTLYYTGGR